MSEEPKSLIARMGSVVPLLVAVFSLLLTVYEARSARQSRLVSVWPRLSVAISDTAGHFTREVMNVGVGPALVRSMHVYVEDKPVRDWSEMLTALLHSPPRGNWYYSSFGRGSVLLPGARLSLLSVANDSIATKLVIAEKLVRTTVCYCSLYEECWEARSDLADPVPIKACSEADATEFGR